MYLISACESDRHAHLIILKNVNVDFSRARDGRHRECAAHPARSYPSPSAKSDKSHTLSKIIHLLL